MVDAATLAQMNGAYVLPEDAGPAWREAHALGYDLSLIADALTKTPEERLDDHQLILNQLLEIEAAREFNK